MSATTIRYDAAGDDAIGLQSWRAMVVQLLSCRELSWRLFLRDLMAGYRESYLGYAWAVFPTLSTALIFTWLNRSQLLSVGENPLPYPLFVLLGMTAWQFFAGALSSMTLCLSGASQLITKVRFPRESLLLATLGRQVFDVGIRAIVLVVAFAAFRIVPAWTVIFAPLLLIPLGLLALGIGGILAVTNAVMRDVGHVVSAVLGFWMLLTPVVYPAPTEGSRVWLNTVNPVSPFVIALHDLTTRGHLTQPAGFAFGCVVALVIFLLGWRVFYVAEASVAERV